MTELPESRQAGPAAQARAISRVAWRMARRTRPVSAAAAAAGGFLTHVGRTLRSLWLEVTGAFFAVFAAVFGAAAGREWMRGNSDSSRFVLALCLGVLFAWFAGTSFWRARRKH